VLRMSTESEDYNSACDDWEVAIQKAAETAKTIEAAGLFMGEWWTVTVTIANTPKPPKDNPTYHIDGSTWPSGIEIAETFDAFHKATRRVRDSWLDLSEDERRTHDSPATVFAKWPEVPLTDA
jgi:hypothetical protein